MGGFTSKTQEDLKIYLEREYNLENYPFIVHKINKKKAFVHEVTTDSREQAQRIRRDVNLYRHLGCKSINEILEYVPLQSSKICSQQEYHYILQARDQVYDLKEEFYARKYYKEGFSTRQIINIIKTYLCGLQVFHKQFQRHFKGHIGLQSVTVDQNHSNQLRMNDPLLYTSYTSNNDDLSSKSFSIDSSLPQLDQKTLIFEAPQRSQQKKTRFNQSKVQLNQLLADIYIIGIIALQLYKMQIFEKKQTHQNLQAQIQSVRDNELKMLLNVMTAYKPDERGKVYELLAVSGGEAYCLERSSRKGKLNKNQVSVLNSNQSYLGVNRNNLYENQNSYSFGGSFYRKQTTLSQGVSMIDNVNRRTTNAILIDDRRKDASNEKIGFIRSQNKTQHNFTGFPLKLLGKQSSSNMSTQRTFTSTLNTQRSFSKPTVVFNQEHSILNSIPPSKPTHYNTAPYLSTNIPQFNRTNTPLFTQPVSSDIHSSSPSYLSKIDSLLNKDVIKPRANSFLFAQQNRLPPKIGVEQSPLKKYQNTSPISHYEHSQSKINQKNINQQQQYVQRFSNPSPSVPKTLTSNKKAQQEIKDLLKQPSKNQNLNSIQSTPLSHINNLSPIPQQTNKQIIKIQEVNQVTKFTLMTEKNPVQSNHAAIDVNQENLPIYRPNKEVEQILKRLGIGSLLYGENQKKQDNQKNINIPQNDKESSKFDGCQTTLHEGTYKINNLSKPQSTLNQTQIFVSQEQESVPQNNEATPVRQPKKPKFNSTIVQVGDEDSQYSQSVKNNDQNGIDLTYHEYVVEEYETGSRYEGYKLNGQRDGEGKFYYQDGGYYEGQWRANKMHGWGKLYYEGGKLAYQGNWHQDQFHGFGKVYNDNPIQLQCGFDFTNFDLLQDYWEYYEGMLVKDTKEGRGKIMLTNGEMFEGDFNNDRIQGFGKFFMKDGTIIEGIWRDSKLIKIIS